VDFNDPGLEDQTFVKKKLLEQHKQTLPHYIFDGSMIFSIVRLFPASWLFPIQ
jgi:hypothetical protein